MAFLRYACDTFVLVLAFAGAFLLRLDFSIYLSWCARMLLHLPFVVGCELIAMHCLGATKGAWRFVALPDAKKIATAILVAQIPIFLLRIVFGAIVAMSPDSHPWMRYGILPWGVLCFNAALAIFALVGMRGLRRMIFEASIQKSLATDNTAQTAVIIGSGSGVKSLIESIRMHPELGLDVIGLVTTDSEDAGRQISGFPVLGSLADIAAIMRKTAPAQAIIHQADADAKALSCILNACADNHIKTRIVPCMNDFLSGSVDIGKIRDISVEDLLRRDPVMLDEEGISRFLHGRRILVSGAGGSIGSEICRQVLAFEPAELVLLERCELFLYEIERELRGKFDKTRIIPRLADICDADRMHEVFAETRPEVVFHAAAYKHVPMLEYNPGEAIRNNVEGTMQIADCAVEHGVDAFVMISTDKAVNPTSIMGTSKRIAELYVQALSGLGKTRFCAVRFGNVLGSTGSVIPLFRAQIQAGGPVTVTHPDMVRYFMTIPEASQLVMQAATMGKNGEIFVLDMGKPVKIVDLARDLIRLSGKTEDDIPIVFSGTRPGEKLFEELGFNSEHMDHTGHPKIYVGKLKPVDLQEIRAAIEKLKPLRDSQDNAAVRAAMREIVPEMTDPA